MQLRAGDQVEVKGKEEILKTLDKMGQLEGLPFMPQMFTYCGQRHQVYKRAHKTCDTVNRTGGRRISDCVHLDLRCDGEAHGGCQADCLIFWKTAWLKPVDAAPAYTGPATRVGGERANEDCCTESEVSSATRAGVEESEDVVYMCQATQLPYFSQLLPWWDLRQYVEDYASRNVTFGRLFSGFAYAAYYSLCQAMKKRRGGFSLLRLYDLFQSVRGGIPYPRWAGMIPAGQPTPICTLNLQPGEIVKVKSYKEILETLDAQNKNRGLYFDAEMVPYCGGTFKVRKRVNDFIDEKTGKTLTMKTPAIILENVWCQARYSDCRMFCPRSIYSWWREIWLERVAENTRD